MLLRSTLPQDEAIPRSHWCLRDGCDKFMARPFIKYIRHGQSALALCSIGTGSIHPFWRAYADNLVAIMNPPTIKTFVLLYIDRSEPFCMICCVSRELRFNCATVTSTFCSTSHQNDSPRP